MHLSPLRKNLICTADFHYNLNNDFKALKDTQEDVTVGCFFLYHNSRKKQPCALCKQYILILFFLCLGNLCLAALKSSQPANSCHLSACVTTASSVRAVKSCTELKTIHFLTVSGNKFLLFSAFTAEHLYSLQGVCFSSELTISKKTWQASMVLSSSQTWSCYRTCDN